MGERIGYARCSSAGQNLEVQKDKLQHAGCNPIFSEKRSGATADNRPELQKALAYARKGDTFIVTRLDRFARGILDLHRMISLLQEKGVAFSAIDQPEIDTTTSAGRLTYSVLAAVASFERELIKERQLDGIRRAKAHGVKFGRRPVLTDEQRIEIAKLKNAGTYSIEQLCTKFSIAPATVYRCLQLEGVGRSA